jgi:hypothetical protein
MSDGDWQCVGKHVGAAVAVGEADQGTGDRMTLPNIKS